MPPEPNHFFASSIVSITVFTAVTTIITTLMIVEAELILLYFKVRHKELSK
jgi:hypothetical protein